MKDPNEDLIFHPNSPIYDKDEKDSFYSLDLKECLQHYHDNGKIDPLENAIDENSQRIENATKELQMLIDMFGTLPDKDFVFNKLIRIRNTINNKF